MKVLAVGSQKGGVSKSTSRLYLATSRDNPRTTFAGLDDLPAGLR